MDSENSHPESEMSSIVFKAHISTKRKEDNYIFKFEGDKIDHTATSALLQELPGELENIYGLKVSIKVNHVRKGSLVIFFTVILTAYSIISSYKGFYESIELIKKQSADLLEMRLQELDPSLIVEVTTVNPNHNEHGLTAKRPFNVVSKIVANNCFFYFLLILSIVEFIAIAWMVHFAIIRTYL